MDLSERLVREPWFRKLDVRASSFFQMVKHLDNVPPGCIIETGCAWDKNNWSGQGQSTLIWDWVLDRKRHLCGFSIDITPEHVVIAKEQTKNITFVLSDSVKALSEFDRSALNSCRLLYLDSFDWHEELNLESAFHHMAELTAAWAHLPSGCMIAVDDRHGPQRGKHWLVEAFFNKLGIEPVFCDYQIAWLKG